MLANPACRLLTLVGTGGVGKTRLAIQAADATQDDFAHGVYFVPLQPVSSTEFLTSAVADALGFPLSGPEDPRVHLLNHLQDKELLLVLDNFEHLLRHSDSLDRSDAGSIEGDGIGLLTDILQRTPAVQLLVTSREVLNVREEWLYPVHGLDVPPGDASDDLGAYTAVGLFIERARRVQPDFSLDDEGLAVAEICRLVEGVPLAIELAASWTRMLACTEIAAEIRRNADFLATSLRDVPDRHRSMRAVFDQSWRFLAAEERDIFKRLAEFRGGFDVEAAAAVGGASLPVLAVFTDKSLLQRQPDGRYQIHELLRQYAAERLAQSSEDVAGVRDLHCVHYADFLRRRFEDITGGRQREAASETENADLFWGLRGGGGNFGIVISFEFRLYPVGPGVMYASTMYPAEKAGHILRAWRDYVTTAPDEVTSDATLWTVLPIPDIPEELHGRQIVLIEAVYAGAVAAGERLLQPLRELDEPLLDMSGPVPYVVLQSALDDLVPKGAHHCYWKSTYLNDLGDSVIDAIVDWGVDRPSPKTLVPIRHLGSALSRIGPEATAFGDRSAPYLLSIDSTWEDPSVTEENIAWTRAFWADMQRFSNGATYFNFPGLLEEGEALMQSTFGANYARLVEVKNEYDPTNLFRLNHNIKPTV